MGRCRLFFGNDVKESDQQGTRMLPILIERDGPAEHPLIDQTVRMTPTEMLEGEVSLPLRKDA